MGTAVVWMEAQEAGCPAATSQYHHAIGELLLLDDANRRAVVLPAASQQIVLKLSEY